MASLAPADVLRVQDVLLSCERPLRPKLASVKRGSAASSNFEILSIAAFYGTALALPRHRGSRRKMDANAATLTCLRARGGEAETRYSYSNAIDRLDTVKGSNLRTTIKITRGVLDPSNNTLAKVYKEFGSCVAVLDKDADSVHGAELGMYFETNGITFVKLVLSDKVKNNEGEAMATTTAMAQRVAQTQQGPLLVVGGEPMAGFAAELLSQSTSHIFLCTSDRAVAEEASVFDHLIFNLPALTL